MRALALILMAAMGLAGCVTTGAPVPAAQPTGAGTSDKVAHPCHGLLQRHGHGIDEGRRNQAAAT